MTSEILSVKKSIRRSDEILSQQYHTYTPYSTAFNNNDEIRITIQSQDLYVLPSDSYLHVEFSIARRDGVAIAANDARFSSFFAAHMFSELRYEINGFEIDRCKLPGITTNMKLLMACKQSDSEALHLFNLNRNAQIITGTFRMIIPLRFMFGFCDDFDKIILNCKHELILVRHRSDVNMYIGIAGLNLNFNVNKIVWKVPHVTLNDEAKLGMLRTIARNEDLLLSFRSWDLYELPVLPQTTRNTWSVKTTSKVNKPRFVVVGLQTNRSNVVTSDPSLFDHCNINDMKLYLNNERFPYDDLNLSFAQNSYHELLWSNSRIQRSYYNGTGGTTPIGNWPSFEMLPTRALFAFDCSRTDESLKNGMVDVRIEIETSENIPENTTAYCLIIHDNLIRYSPFTSIVQREI